MTRTVIATPHAPAAVGPYSQAIRSGNLVFTAGQIGLDPSTGKIVEGLENQVEQVLSNLRAVLDAAGSSLDQAVKTTIFLADMADFAQVNAIYGRAFSVTPPARSTIQATGLPLGALVEIEVIALAGD